MNVYRGRCEQCGQTLEHLLSDDFVKGGDRPARELLVEAMVMLGSDPEIWVSDYRDAVARAIHAPSYGRE